jgi:serine protease AprX
MSIYPLFKKKIETISNDKVLNVLISFENLSKREEFINKYEKLTILNKFEFIPGISTKMKKEDVLQLEKEKLIIQIEEDQRIYFSMLDLMEILEIDYFQNTQISYKGSRVNIGILDDGINPNFSSIPKPQTIINKYDESEYFKSSGSEITHGSIMASIICNQFKDKHGNYIGIAPNVNLIDLRLTGNKKKYYFSNILTIFERIKKNIKEVDILLISLTTSEPSDGKDILSLSCNLLVENGLIIVCPSGNFGSKKYTIGSPGAAEKVITIGALNKDFSMTNYSGKGPTLDERLKPDLCFPGSDLIVPLSNKLRVKVSGTSISAAIGAGLIALIKDYDSSLSYKQVLDLLKKSSIDLNYESTSQGMGTVTITDIFRQLEILHERVIPYNYLIRKAMKITFEFLILIIILFYIIIFLKIT